MWVQTGYWKPDPIDSGGNVPNDPIDSIDDPGDPFHWCSPGYHPIRIPVVTGPYLYEPKYRLEYFWYCVLD